MKPVPLSAYIPPVTGVGGVLSAVVSNSFDHSGLFPTRPRLNSAFKRRRDDNDEFSSRFDLTRDFPPLIHPERQSLDIDAVNSLMVGAAELVPAIREKLDGVDVSEDTKMLAKFGLSMFSLLEAIVEKAVRPMASAPSNMGGGAAGSRPVPPVVPPKPDADRRELAEALAKAERTAILHDANLGTVPIANRQKLCHALSAGLREAALRKAEGGVGDPAEAVRIADDALSLVKDMTFLGQASKKVNNPRKPDLDHMSMPIKLEFDDRNSRIHFERTMLDKCNIKASMSLPKPVRTALNKFHDNLKIRYPDEITMARVDTYKLRFIAFHKEDGGPKWEPCPEWLAIPLDILKDGNAPPAGTGDSGGATPMVVS